MHYANEPMHALFLSVCTHDAMACQGVFGGLKVIVEVFDSVVRHVELLPWGSELPLYSLGNVVTTEAKEFLEPRSEPTFFFVCFVPSALLASTSFPTFFA